MLVRFANEAAHQAPGEAADIDPYDKKGLRAEALAARRDGFAGKMVVDAAQTAVINAVFCRE